MIAWVATSLRRMRSDRLASFGVAVLLFVTALLAASTPLLVARASDETLRATVAEALPATRNIQFVQDALLIAGNNDTNQFSAIDDLQTQLFGTLPPAVARLVSDSGWTISSARWVTSPRHGDSATMRLRIQPDAMDRLTLEQGRWPTDQVTKTRDAGSSDVPAPLVQTFEAVISTATARALQVALGDVVSLATDNSDPLVGARPRSAIAVTIVGLYRVNDPTDSWWLGDSGLAQPSVRSPGGDARINDATALLSPDAYVPYLHATIDATPSNALPLFLHYTYREYVDPARLHAADVDGLLADFKRLESTYPPTVRPFLQDAFQQTAMREGIRQLIDTYRVRWASASAVLTIVAIGPAAVAIGTLALVVGFASTRRRAALALARGRGASSGQVLAAVGIEGLVLTIPGAALAIALALVLVSGVPGAAGVAAGTAVAVIATLLIVGGTLRAVGGTVFATARDSAPAAASARRLVLEALVVALALGGAVLLRERGLRGTSSTGQLGQADPLVAAVPALIGIAAALIAVRLFPIPMRLLAWFARRARGLVPVLAMRRATDGRHVGATLVVLIVTASVWAFSSSVLVYLDRASDASAWRDVGAAYRIRSPSGFIPSGFDPASVPGVEAVAAGHFAQVEMGNGRLNVDLMVLDVVGYEAVTAGTPAAIDLPIDLYAATAETIPVVVSRAVIDRPEGVKIGDEFNVLLGGLQFPFRVVGVIGDVPGMALGTQFGIVSMSQMQALRATVSLTPSIVFVRAPASAADGIAAAAAAVMPAGALIDSRSAETAGIQESPSARAIAAGLAWATAVTFLYAVLALGAALALSGASRATEVAHLRTLGLNERQVVGLVIVEHGPVVVTAVAVGLGLGFAIFGVLRQGLGLDAFVGSGIDVSLTPDPGQLVAVLGGIVAVAVLGLVLGTLMQRGAAPTAALRRGFE